VKSVYSSQDLLTIGHLRNVLVNEGIPCDVRTPFLAAAKGDVPVTDCWSELWVARDEDHDRALGVIRAALAAGDEPQRSWRCPRCSEEIEGQFEECWQCGSARPGADA
jgi:Putative prokaryotic signal transducing protein